MGFELFIEIMKILVLVMSHRTDDPSFVFLRSLWDSLITNIKTKNYNIDVLFLYSDSNLDKEYEVINNELITRCEENYWDSLLIKAVNGFDYFMKNDYDLVFKTNLSTILNLDNFYNNCLSLNIDDGYIYNGFIGKYKNFNFVSGAGMLLNKNSVNLILKNKHEITSDWTDDIFFGFILNHKYKIEPTYNGLTRYDITYSHQNIEDDLIKSSTHVRIKVRKENKDLEFSNKVYLLLYN